MTLVRVLILNITTEEMSFLGCSNKKDALFRGDNLNFRIKSRITSRLKRCLDLPLSRTFCADFRILNLKRAATAHFRDDVVDGYRVIASAKRKGFEDYFDALNERGMNITQECRDPAVLFRDEVVLVSRATPT